MTSQARRGPIGIIGVGNIGQAFARTALRAGRQVMIANSRGPQSLGPVVAALGPGASAGTTGEAAASAMVVIAVPWTSIPAAVAGLTWQGQIVLDATNPFVFPEFRPANLDDRSSSEIVANWSGVPGWSRPLTRSRPGCSAATRTRRAAAESCSCRVTTLRPRRRSPSCSMPRGSRRSIWVTCPPGDACSSPRPARWRAATWWSCRESGWDATGSPFFDRRADHVKAVAESREGREEIQCVRLR